MEDETNLPKQSERVFEQSKLFLIPLYAVIFWCVATWVHGLMLFSGEYPKSMSFLFQQKPESNWDLFCYFVGISFFGALAQGNGHEMIHKQEDINKFVGGIPFFLVSYSHFGPEHVKGHHKHIATDMDPVSTPMNQSFYYHIVKAVIGTHVSSWNREIERIEKTGGHWLFSNVMFMYFLMHCGLWVSTFLAFGKGGLWFHTLYTAAGLFWVEAINYLEHYGLLRDKDGDVYEAVTGFHSWNAPASTCSAKIQRHSDHHCHGRRPYQILRHFKDVPMLPYEYIICIILSLNPPLWYYVMNPKVEAVMRAKRG